MRDQILRCKLATVLQYRVIFFPAEAPTPGSSFTGISRGRISLSLFFLPSRKTDNVVGSMSVFIVFRARAYTPERYIA